ncbi:MAG: YIP1 family protein [Candidatus Thorarchaeota archaeon]|nr:YIP1 family protein [Candidatus Thorarchaeota archaeon]
MVRRCEFCDSPVPADATICPVCRETIAEEAVERILPLLKRPESKEIRFMSIRERLWGVLRRPSATYRDVGQRPDAAGPFIIIVMNAVVMMGMFLGLSSKINTQVVVNATAGTTAEVNVLFSQSGVSFLTVAIVGIMPGLMLGIVYLLIGTAFAHFAFKLTGGSGGKMKTLSIVGYSMFPVVLVRLVSILVVLVIVPSYPILIDMSDPLAIQAAAANLVNWAYTLNVWYIIDVMTTGAFVWTGFLLIFGIREAHDTSTIWAIVVSILCTIVLGLTFWQVH